ncbi:MAG: putative galactarate transporter [Rhodobiaceae bacterium UBA7378]|nr:MAG: putative galactarate transporter [Rhodobiaceae bacterium UBA7378]|tara:strand:- start:1509 stop:2783 length:1275 start_codon:yes stop_codon:yes gene_type:complete
MTTTNFTPAVKAYTVGLLTFIFTANYVDRQIVAILLQSIKVDMGLTDTQLGLLSGLAFAIFYATLGIPIAYLADRMSRKKIIIVSLSLFSIMTFVCGFAQNFWQLLLARIGVGVGEAGTSPPSHAMIADMYVANERATPLAIFALGINIGLLIAFLVGGWVNHHYGWRAAFQIVALPGLLLVVVAMFTLRDPPRGLSDDFEVKAAPPLRDVATYMWASSTLRHLIIGSTLLVTVGYGAVAWLPTYFVRVHGLTTIEVGQILALIIGIGGGIGTALGGNIADRLGKRDVRWNFWLIALLGLFGLPFSVASYLSVDTTAAILLMILPVCVGAVYFGPTLAMLHTLVKPEMRSLSSAILLFINNIIGLGLGPLMIGVMSDYLSTDYGARALPYAMAASTLLSIWAAVHLWLASRTLPADIEKVRQTA